MPNLPYKTDPPKEMAPSSQSSNNKDGLSGGVIASIVIIGILVIAAIFAITTYIIRTRRDQMEEQKSTRFAHSVGKPNLSPTPTLLSTRAKIKQKLKLSSPKMVSRSPSTTSSFGEKEGYNDNDFENVQQPVSTLLNGFGYNSESYSLTTQTPTDSTFAFQQNRTNSTMFPSIPSTPTYIDDLPQSPLESPTADVRTVKLSFAPTMEDEIAVMTGDTVLLLKEWDDGWAFVVKLNQEGEFKEEGVIPMESLLDKTPKSHKFNSISQSVLSLPSRMSLSKPSMSTVGSRRSGVRISSIRSFQP